MRLLDLYSCAGGSARGYQLAGFHVTGVDINPQPHYAGDVFHRADALYFLSQHAHEFDVIHASPPCQHASAGTRAQDRDRYPRLIEPTRELLAESGKPYIIENVAGSALLTPLLLCGSMFDLTAVDDDGTTLHLQRHRLFESNMPLYAPRPCHHPRGVQWAGSYGGARRDKDEARNVRHGGYVPSAAVQGRLLGIDWMPEKAMHQAIPPAYTAWLGAIVRDQLERAA